MVRGDHLRRARTGIDHTTLSPPLSRPARDEVLEPESLTVDVCGGMALPESSVASRNAKFARVSSFTFSTTMATNPSSLWPALT